jgi:hypothetical protein
MVEFIVAFPFRGLGRKRKLFQSNSLYMGETSLERGDLAMVSLGQSSLYQ